MSSSDHLINVNGFWVELDTVESTLIISLSSYSLISVKLVAYSNGSRLALFYTSLMTTDELAFLKAARDVLLTSPSFPEVLASLITFAQQLPEMPASEDGYIDTTALRAISEERWEKRKSARKSRGGLSPLSPPATNPQGRAVSMPPMALSAFSSSSSTAIPTINIYSPDHLTPVMEDRASLSPSIASSYSPSFNTTPIYPPPVGRTSIMKVSMKHRIALEIASHVTTLLCLPASSSVPTYLPLRLAGLNSVTTAQLYFWLQERYEYDEDISRLFEDGVSAELIAVHIAGDSTVSSAGIDNRDSVASTATAASEYSDAPTEKFTETFEENSFDEVNLETGSKRQVHEKPAVYKINPNPLSYVTLSWMTSLMFVGNRKPLVQDDLYDMHHNDESRTVDAWTNDFWKEYDAWSRDPSKKQPKLWASCMKASRKYVYTSAVLWFFYICCALFAPILIQQLIVCVNVVSMPNFDAKNPTWILAIKTLTGGVPLFTPSLYILAGTLFGSKVGQTTCGRTADNLIRRVALNIKTALVGAVYRKSLRLGVQGIGRYEKGQILNLVNVDAEAVSKAIELGNLTWSIPFQIGMIIYLLYRVLGVSVWAGVGVLFAALLALILVVPMFFRVSAPMFMRYGDKRMKSIKEIMEGMTLIKVRGWEALFLQRLETIRQTQLTFLKTFNTGVAVFVIVGQLANTLVPIAALSLFGKESGVITAARVFPAISFFSMLVEPLIALPQLLSAVAIALTSWNRIYTFLIASETAPVHDARTSPTAEPIKISNGSFKWSTKADAEPKESSEKVKTFVHDINISIKKGSLTAIVGSVGCGKSSVLSAMLGEMECVSGQVTTSGSIAYCPQQAWIESSTVQDNILFGKPMDVKRMKKAIGAASFAADLERLPNGLTSEIAERGANLSGGQKARLSLARAVYADADNVLLDDPLAALDPRVGRTVFNECIRGALHGKTRVLVTQALHFLPQVDHIIVIKDGTVAEQGTYGQLYRQNGQLRKMVEAMEKLSDKSEKKEAKAAGPAAAAKQEAPKVVEDAPSGTLVSEEDITTGAISGATWWSYLKAAGGWVLIIALLTALLSQQAGTVMMNQWLTWWTLNQFKQKIQFWFGVYDGIGFLIAFLMVGVNICILFGSLNASRTFHNKAFSGVMSAPMAWFHANPAGRVINRFSKDVESVDQRLMPQVIQAVAGFGSLISTVAILAHSAPVILAIIVPLMVFYFFLLRFYRRSLRELKRLESRSRSPLQSKVNETLDGIPTIAAFGRCMDFAGSAHYLIDESNKPVYLRTAAEIWVTLRLEFLSAFVILAVAMLGKDTKVMNMSQFGSALSYANGLTYILNLLVKSTAAIESEMSSVEGLQEYAEKLPMDAATHLVTDPAEGSWPSRGEIVFKGVTAAYPSRPEKKVLKDVNVRIEPGTTTFLVGRTGSGKSTILNVLLRLLEMGEGSVVVDGEDITQLGVHTLRRGMELIPQDPFIFSGTIRTALDFEGRYDDTSLWHALELVGMKDFVASEEEKLDTVVADNGSNFSVGQRQLLCLAGAILRSPRILLLDEATASQDAGSDAFLQRTMRQNCPGATILSVMHRLSDQVLKECDKVLVMDNGGPAEFDTPRNLMADPNSLFSQIMEATKH